LIFQIQRHHVEKHVQRLVDLQAFRNDVSNILKRHPSTESGRGSYKTGHEKHERDRFPFVIGPEGRQKPDEESLDADEEQNLPLFMRKSGTDYPD
jgi:hypothetical protein